MDRVLIEMGELMKVQESSRRLADPVVKKGIVTELGISQNPNRLYVSLVTGND